MEIEELETAFGKLSSANAASSFRDVRLERMEYFLSYLGNPERRFNTYHIAGSKGKGSTAIYLASLLEGSGRRCGLYTSPHLFSVRERFTRTGRFFPDKLYIDVFELLRDEVSIFSMPDHLGPEKPTEFELYTAYGYLLFKEAGCTDAVIETGLGGRLDATNTIDSIASLITPIELEHTAILGDTIEKIAREKAGIIRPSSPTFVALQEKDAEAVFRKKADEIGSPISFLSDALSNLSCRTEIDGEHASFDLKGNHYSLTLEMATEKMAENAALALLAGLELGIVTEDGIKRMEKATLPGRFERHIADGRLLVIDTAHTPNSARESAKSFEAISGKDRVLIFSLAEGKDEEGFIREIARPFERIIVTQIGGYKKSNHEHLAALANGIYPEKRIELISDPDAALESALSTYSDILITGSFYLPGEMRGLRSIL